MNLTKINLINTKFKNMNTSNIKSDKYTSNCYKSAWPSTVQRGQRCTEEDHAGPVLTLLTAVSLLMQRRQWQRQRCQSQAAAAKALFVSKN